MHGVSAIIAVILIIVIVVALVVMTYIFSLSIFTTTTSRTEQSINTSTKSFLTNMKIESVSDDKIYIRNIGQTDITDFGLFIGDSPIGYDVDKIPLPPGEVATITINKIYNEVTGSYEIPAGDIKISSGAVSVTYKNYQGDMCGSYPEIVNQQSFSSFTNPVKGYTVKATACDAEGLKNMTGCEIYYKRKNDRVDFSIIYKDSISFPEVIYNNSTGDCTFNITVLDTGDLYWSNYSGSVSSHSLAIDNNYVYIGDTGSVVYKYLKEDGSLEISRDVGTGTTVRGLSIDNDFIYFGDANSNLTKVRKTDLQIDLTIKYSISSYPIYATAVDDTGVYWGNNQYNVSKVNKTNLGQIFWTLDYGSGTVTDMDVDESYLYFAASADYNITKVDKNTGAKIWSIKPSPTGTRWAVVLDGNNLWVGDSNYILWQIDKVTGNIINYTDYGTGVIYEISFDNDFLYLSDNAGNLNKVNKTSKEREYLSNFGAISYGLACDMDYCYSVSSNFAAKIFKDVNSKNYKTGEKIASLVRFYDGDFNSVETYESVNTFP